MSGLRLANSPGVSLPQAHEDPDCSFPANITDRANLTVAGAALSALGGADLFPTHGTVFLPNDAAFTALVTALSEQLDLQAVGAGQLMCMRSKCLGCVVQRALCCPAHCDHAT